jgi:hypothetical protein
MTEQTFRSPGFFEREVDLSQRTTEIEGVPAGIIGTSTIGPAFVPVTIGSYVDFKNKFGNLTKDQFGPFAVREWLKNRTAVTFIKVLGAGSANSTSDIIDTNTMGTVKNAGFIVKGERVSTSAGGGNPHDNTHAGAVQFLAASHTINSKEATGNPVFTDNDSFDTSSQIRLVRAMIMTAQGAKIQIIDHDVEYSSEATGSDLAKISSYDSTKTEGTFKLVVSSSMGSSFGNDEGKPGIKIYTASLNPTSDFYIGKFLNKNPERFYDEQHLLYADFPVEGELASVSYNAGAGTVALVSGSEGTSSTSGDTGLIFRDAFGRFDTRYTSAKTTAFISQPFGSKEYDLFHFESIDDGEAGNKRVKISISDLKKSTNPKDKFGTFTVLVRDFNDTDTNMKVLEQYTQCSLNPNSENYVASKIGDMKVYFNFNAETESERRINVLGKRPNKSSFVRIVMNNDVELQNIPKETLPFGFRGVPLLKTNDNMTDDDNVLSGGSLRSRLACVEDGGVANESLTGSILPPVPFRFKATRGSVLDDVSPAYIGYPGALELSDNRLFWGVKFETVPDARKISDPLLNSNASANKNKLIDSYSKFIGIQKLDTLHTGSGADLFNNNKFSLSKVALSSEISLGTSIEASISTVITGTADQHMRETAYLRNGELEFKNYSIRDRESDNYRVTFATLAAARDAKYFNRFSGYAKFTNMMYGGFDGLNILDRDQKLMNDKASSVDGGKADGSSLGHLGLHSDSSPGAGKENNIVNSYRSAARIITDPFASRVNIVAVPGIREPFVTDHVSELVRDYNKALYIMDVPAYNEGRIFGKTSLPSVQDTVDAFEARSIDNSYVATYFPDVVMEDEETNTNVTVPASVAAIKSLGYNDAISYPWFAPAGFNRGALNNVVNSATRLSAEDRNILYESRINPIATFPNGGFVIFGQKTLQQDRSALDRVNVRRMLLEVKRIVSDIANKMIFEQNTPQTRARFVAEVTPELSTIQLQQGIDQFKVVMDSSNNSSKDIEANQLNGRIVLVPTRAIEFIAVDFIITNSGVSFD